MKLGRAFAAASGKHYEESNSRYSGFSDAPKCTWDVSVNKAMCNELIELSKDVGNLMDRYQDICLWSRTIISHNNKLLEIVNGHNLPCLENDNFFRFVRWVEVIKRIQMESWEVTAESMLMMSRVTIMLRNGIYNWAFSQWKITLGSSSIAYMGVFELLWYCIKLLLVCSALSLVSEVYKVLLLDCFYSPIYKGVSYWLSCFSTVFYVL